MGAPLKNFRSSKNTKMIATDAATPKEDVDDFRRALRIGLKG